MRSQYRYPWRNEPILAMAIIGFVLSVSFYKLEAMAQWCGLLDRTGWVVFVVLKVLRPVASVTDWHGALTYLYVGAGFLQLSLCIGACISRLLCVVAGQA